MTKYFPLVLAVGCLSGGFMSVLQGDDLDALLEKKDAKSSLSESEGFQAGWDRLVGFLAARDYAGAETSLKSLGSERSYIAPRRRDFINLTDRSIHFKDGLDGDKEIFRKQYKQANDAVAEAEGTLFLLKKEAEKLVAQHGNYVPALRKEQMEKKYFELQAIITERKKVVEGMKAEAQDFESARYAKLEEAVAEWIKNDDTEENVVTGLLLSTIYLDKVGDSAKVRALSQNLQAKQEEIDKSNRIVKTVASEIEPLAADGQADQAQSRLRALIAKIEASDQTDFVKTDAVTKLKAFSLKLSAMKSPGELAKADRMVAEIETKIMPLLSSGREDEAQDLLWELTARVETGNENAAVKKAAIAKLGVLSAKVRAAKHRQELIKADGIAGAIERELDPLLSSGKGMEAQIRLEESIARIETGNDSDFVKKTAAAKLRVISMKIASSTERSQHEAADRVVASAETKIRPLLAANDPAAAATELEEIIAGVEAQPGTDFGKRITIAKLRSLAIRIEGARHKEKEKQASSMAESAEMSGRLETLEIKLGAAQEFFGTLIRSIDGFSTYTGRFEASDGDEKIRASLEEKVKAGAVAKEKVDNMIKARAEHEGILQEVRLLSSDPAKLSLVQRGRLANLQATAESAVAALKGIPAR